jgi:hypothetical protein
MPVSIELNFLGIERLLGRMRKLSQRPSRRVDERAWRAHRVAYFLEYLLPPNSATALHVIFLTRGRSGM